MKEFVIYTVLRMLLLAGAFALVVGVWLAFDDTVSVPWALVAAVLLSGVGSYFLLNGFRDRFARTVQRRAERATAAFDKMKAREDTD